MSGRSFFGFADLTLKAELETLSFFSSSGILTTLPLIISYPSSTFGTSPPPPQQHHYHHDIFYDIITTFLSRHHPERQHSTAQQQGQKLEAWEISTGKWRYLLIKIQDEQVAPCPLHH